MTDLEKIQHQLEKAMKELNELDTNETELAYDYIEYANILVKNLILLGVSRGKQIKHKTVFDYTQETIDNAIKCAELANKVKNGEFTQNTEDKKPS